MPNFIKSQLWKLIFTKIYKYLNPIARKSYSLNYVHKSYSIFYNFFLYHKVLKVFVCEVAFVKRQ